MTDVKCSTPQCNKLAFHPFDRCEDCEPFGTMGAPAGHQGATLGIDGLANGGDVEIPAGNGPVPTQSGGDVVIAHGDDAEFTPTGKEVKPRLELVPFDFIIEMAKVFQAGLRSGDGTRNANDWQRLDSTAVAGEYRGALLRHYAAGEWAGVAVNAAILWWHERKTTSASQ